MSRSSSAASTPRTSSDSDAGAGGAVAVGAFRRVGAPQQAGAAAAADAVPLHPGELAQLQALEARITRAVAEQTRVMETLTASLVRPWRCSAPWLQP